MRTKLTILVLLASLLQQARIPGPGGTPPAAGGGQAVTQSCIATSANDEQTSGTTNSCVFGSSVTAGHGLVFFVKRDDTAGTITTALNAMMTGETFTAATLRTSTNASQQIRTYYLCNAAGGQTAFSYTLNSSQFNTVSGYEFSGQTPGGCFDTETGGQTVSASPSFSMSVAAGALAFLSSQTNNYTSYTATGAGSTGTYTLGKLTGHQTTLNTNPVQGAEEYQTFASSGSKTASFTTTGTNNFASEFISFK